MCFLIELLTDPNFLGSLAGAIISSLIAIYIMNKNNINAKKQEKKKELSEFLKESRFLLYSVEKLISYIGVYAGYQKEEETINRFDTGPEPNAKLHDIQHAKRLNETDIAECLRKIKNVNRNAFTRDSFDIYLNILSITEGKIDYFWQRSLKIDVGGVGEILKEGIKELNIFKESLEQKYEEKEEEYNNL